MHVDAFFEFLMEKSHVYWTEIPPSDEPPSELGRDGVTLEEDLALRALLPEMRPKRGRRKNEDKDDDDASTPSQRPRLDSPTLSEDFMLARTPLIGDVNTPTTANTSFTHGFDNRMSSWSSADAFYGSQTPSTAYPQSAQSAVTPSNRNLLWPDSNEPQPRSAIASNKPRSRRRHGPAVSSAWPSNGSSTSTGKLRGRPPNNRSATDGPFSVFPSKETSTISHNTPVATPVVGDSEMPHFFPQNMRAEAPLQAQTGRPNRLQL